MKHTLLRCTLYVAMALSTQAVYAQVKVGNNPTSLNASAVLEMESTTRGMLPPRMTTAQRAAIASPAKGLIVFNTDLNCTETNLGTPTAPNWACLSVAGAQKIQLGGTSILPAISPQTRQLMTGWNVSSVSGFSYNAAAGTITVTRSGDYLVQAQSLGGNWSEAELAAYGITANDHCLILRKNNADISFSCARSSRFGVTATYSSILPLVAGDVLTINITTATGGIGPAPLPLTATTGYSVSFSAYNLSL